MYRPGTSILYTVEPLYMPWENAATQDMQNKGFMAHLRRCIRILMIFTVLYIMSMIYCTLPTVSNVSTVSTVFRLITEPRTINSNLEMVHIWNVKELY